MSTAHPAMATRPRRSVRRLSHEQCRSWLARHDEGRLGYSGGRGQRSVVVRYVLSGDHITFRVPDYNDIAHYAPGQQVSLVVEGLLPALDRYQWVSVTGRAQLAGPGGTSPAQQSELDEWPPAVATRLIALPLTTMDGAVESPA